MPYSVARQTPIIALDFWLLHQNTVVTGFTRCQYRPAVYDLTMKPFGLPLAFASVAACVNLTNVLVAPRLTHAVFMGFPADAAPADSLAIITSMI
jgi:hypothetical protein